MSRESHARMKAGSGDLRVLRFLGVFSAILAGLAAVSFARADTLAVDLSDRSLLEPTSTTGLWDVVRSRISVPFSAGGTAAKIISFGDGTDGEFNDGPTQSGITVSGSTITFDTNVKSTFQFTTFTLSSTKIIQVTGAAALVIRVRGAVTIAGQVLAEGTAGTDNAVGSTGSFPGGTGPGNAGAGGAGGVGASAATVGTPASGDSRGGGLGAAVAAAGTQAGGGGGCQGTGPDAGNNATAGLVAAGAGANAAACPRNRTAVSGDFDTLFTNLAGGGGGGGGGANSAAPASTGAGGGGGGGRIAWSALGDFRVEAGGKVSIKGGNGGADNFPVGTGTCGGAGGGGSGGLLWAQTPGSVAGAGTIDIRGGTGGDSTDVGCLNVATGGNGSRGIFRVDDSDAAESGVTVNPARVAANDSSSSVTAVTTGTYTVYSKGLIAAQGLYEFDALTVTTGCGANGSVSVVVEPSDNGTDYTTGVAAADIATLTRKRNIRVKATLTSTGANPPCITGLTLQYRFAEISKFTLEGVPFACARTQGPGRPSGPSGGSRFPGEFLLFALALGYVLREKLRLREL